MFFVIHAGFAIYFGYGIQHSVAQTTQQSKLTTNKPLNSAGSNPSPDTAIWEKEVMIVHLPCLSHIIVALELFPASCRKDPGQIVSPPTCSNPSQARLSCRGDKASTNLEGGGSRCKVLQHSCPWSKTERQGNCHISDVCIYCLATLARNCLSFV